MSSRFVVLDLDCTLVYSRSVNLMSDLKEDARNFYVRPLPGDVIHQTTLRKHVSTFLDALERDGYRVIVWSAGSAPYVKNVISVIFRERKDQLEYLLTYDNLKKGLKDLNAIKEFVPDFDAARARLVDDNPDHSKGQEKSFILVDAFTVKEDSPTPEEDDDILETLIERINASFT